ncbi:hypothetical protein SAMN05216377_102263 [Pseudonocardia oroxyli]|uniref:Uncharacterized protein n=1 Tax=Pseudonocardia oroxyli TaxID=366584 RepID=A0A1G7G958_PSEOR|nr:hypothetical protein SAMN05216377_102263 [Pseudonocardia oroxyli]
MDVVAARPEPALTDDLVDDTALLRGAGLRVTAPRKAVLAAVRANPPTPREG